MTDGAAIAARAYVESYFLAVITEDDGYCTQASTMSRAKNSARHDELHPEVGLSDPNVYIGTVRHHVLSITRSSRDVTLTACTFTYGSAIEESDGSFSAIVGEAFVPSPGIYPMRIGLRAPEDMQSKLPPQEGFSRAPFDNVFAGWKITSHQGGYLSTSRWPEYDRDRAACIAIAKGSPGASAYTRTCRRLRRTFLRCLRIRAGLSSEVPDVVAFFRLRQQCPADLDVALQEPALVEAFSGAATR